MLGLHLLFFMLAALIGYSLYWWKYLRPGKDIPGPPVYPLIGNVLMFLGKPSEILKRVFKISLEYKRLVAFWFGPKLVVILFDPRDIEVILRDRRTMQKADEYTFLKPWLGDSILLSSGMKFRTNKKIMMPKFHPNGLKSFIDIFNVHAKKLVDTLSCKIGKEEFDIQKYLYNTMGEELLETTFGLTHAKFGAENFNDYGDAVSRLCKIAHIRSYKFWLRSDLLFNFSKMKKDQDNALALVHPMTERIIAQRKDEILAQRHAETLNQETGEYGTDNSCDANEKLENLEESKDKRSRDLLDMLLKATKADGSYLTEQEIKDEVLTVMFGGQDTTTVTLGFCLSLLGVHTKVQDKIYEELQEIFGDSDRPATYEDVQKMEYIERVLQETWRLYPPIPAIGRKPNADIQLETCTLPKGCTIVLAIMATHRHTDIYEKPHHFDPDNFLPERVKERHQYSFLPFSGGIRTCIGAKYAMWNAKVLLSTFLRSYRVSAKRPEKTYVLAAETTLKRREGFLISIEKRNKESYLINGTDINSNIEI